MASCARCGTFLCGACTEVREEAAYCADCLAWLHRNGAPSRAVQGLIALNIVALLALPLCFVFAPLLNMGVGVLGLWAGTRELRRIRRGEGPLRGAWQAHTARVLASVNVLVGLASAAFLAYIVSLRL